MRPIKFRGKRTDNDEWIADPSILIDDEICDRVGIMDSTEGLFVDVYPYTLGQFTGLADKNGREIYEGDILRFPPKDKWEETSFVGYEVFWHDNDCCEKNIGFQMNRHHFYGHICGTGDFRSFVPKTIKQMIVIGNIHDNPELLYTISK